jgi:hypothetical protein
MIEVAGTHEPPIPHRVPECLEPWRTLEEKYNKIVPVEEWYTPGNIMGLYSH